MNKDRKGPDFARMREIWASFQGELRISGSPKLVSRTGTTYERRKPERTALYQVVQNNLETLYAAVEEGFRAASLPAFVR